MKRRALVTGGNRGIGRAIATGLTEAGLEVVVGARDLTAGRTVASAIGGRAVEMDLLDPMSVARALEEAGDLDVLVNNAGVLYEAPLFSEDARFEDVMRVMVTAPFELMRALVPKMDRRGYGWVVNVSSNWGSFATGLEGPGAYGVAKAALNALTVKAARDATDGVKINAMCPGWVRTRMGGDEAALSPEQGADTAIWLATLGTDGPTGKFFRGRKEIDW